MHDEDLHKYHITLRSLVYIVSVLTTMCQGDELEVLQGIRNDLWPSIQQVVLEVIECALNGLCSQSLSFKYFTTSGA